MNEVKKSIVLRSLIGAAAVLLSLYAVPNMVFAQGASPNPTGSVPGEVELPVDISIDVLTDGDDATPSTEVTIHMLNSKSGQEVDLILPDTGKPEDAGSNGNGSPFDPPPVDGAPVETPPVMAPPVETPPVDGAPVETPPVDTLPIEVPPVETPPVDTSSPVELIPPVETPPVEAPEVTPTGDVLPPEAPPVETPPVEMP